MKTVIKTAGVLSLTALAAAISPWAAAAEDTEDTGWYGGFNIGQSSATIDDERIISDLQAGGLATTAFTADDTDTGYKIFGAYQFNENFALEGGYFDLGEFGYMATTLPAGTLSGDIEISGWNVDAVGILPFTDRFSAFGRLGLNYANAKDSFSGTGAVLVTNPSPKERDMNYKVGVGLEYDLTESLGLRAEVERYRIDDAIGNMSDIDLLSLGLVFRFGDKKPAAEEPRAVAAPPPPPPAPVYVLVPVAVKTDKYCSVLDLTFEINKEDIQRDDKERLGVLGTFMQKYPKTTAVIEGHADNVGTSEHNLNLSQERAESVATYLIDTFKIAPSRLSAVGYGDTRPVADNSTQKGQRANRRIEAVIACVTDVEGLAVARARVTMALEMEFDPDSADIQPEYRDELQKVAKFMKANPKVSATVEGHADKLSGTGSKQVEVTPELAMEVSQRRATHVVKHLVDLGVDRSRLSTAAYGQTRRVNYGITLEGQQENRRVNIIFNYGK